MGAAKKRTKGELVVQVKRLQVETAKLQEIANRLSDIATVIIIANGLEARIDEEEEGEGEDG